MTIYEIDQAIMECVDLETGEIIDTEQLDKLQMLQRLPAVEIVVLFTRSEKWCRLITSTRTDGTSAAQVYTSLSIFKRL